MKITTSMLVALIMFFVSIKLFFDHREDEYKGQYRYYGGYSGVSSTKNDMFKFAFLELFLLLVLGLAPDQSWFSTEDLLHSGVGRIIVVMLALFVYNEFVLPYGVYYLPQW
jgi:hypothetical protein